MAARRLRDGQLPKPTLAVRQRIGNQALLCMNLRVDATVIMQAQQAVDASIVR